LDGCFDIKSKIILNGKAVHFQNERPFSWLLVSMKIAIVTSGKSDMEANKKLKP